MPSSRAASYTVAAAGVILAAVYLAPVPDAVSGAAVLTVGIGTCLVQAVALRVHRTRDPWPWRFFLGASVAFLVGILVRPWATEQTGAPVGLADAFSVAAYLQMIVAMGLMLRGRVQRHAVTDGVIVVLGTGALMVEVLALPAAQIAGRPGWQSLLAGMFPLFDIVIALLVLNLAFSTAYRLRAFTFLAGAVVLLLAGDLAYAWIGRTGRLTGPKVLDLPFLLGFVCIATAVLHPSVLRFADVRARPVQEWSALRLAIIVPSVFVPLTLVALPYRDTVDVIVIVGALAGTDAALLIRALIAVRGHAEVQRGLKHQATHDALTGLPNRVLLAERTDALIAAHRGGTGAWLLFADLDGFKLINDHWGHEAGDRLLVQVAGCLREVAGPDRIVARISGDEFVVAGSGGAQEGLEVANDLRSRLAYPFDVEGIELVVSGSVGVVQLTDQPDAEALLRDADTAMYRAKSAGRNRTRVFDADMRRAVQERVEIEIALRHAIARRELHLAYQPIVECATGRLVGAEALLRWSRPGLGDVPPDVFVPVAEETGLIEEIGSFVLQESIRQLADWRTDGHLPERFHVSVNASARQLRDEHLHHRIRDLLERYDLPSRRLAVEITESVMMSDTTAIGEILTGLREMGIGLSVDDFGTGYSSLSYLSRFPVTTVKVDRSFVAGLGVDRGDEAIVRAVVAMAAALDLDIVAEGVENEDQRRTLSGLGVRYAQGWLWGRAQPAGRFAAVHLAPITQITQITPSQS